ncbi:MAG TPA: hydrogenase maturation protease [Thermoanaerobaculaceae bacterium]|nr:hydrogenase maturation protease [Thermoanaerobaculaceae bacterium]HRS16377.1 hydrogenase maturation protease [Thermoanaerobaculaceae bacterium]
MLEDLAGDELGGAHPKARVAVVGIGNPLAGDDGVGPEVVRALSESMAPDPRVLLGVLEGDLLEVADWLPKAEHFLFVDAVAGEPPGEIVVGAPAVRAWAPSFHQSDLATTLETLRRMGVAEPFPTWALWGVSILPPRELGTGLSPPVAAAAERLRLRLLSEIERILGWPGGVQATRPATAPASRQPL